MENSEIEDKHFWLAAEDIQKTLEYTKEVQDQLKSYDFSKRERIFQGISSIYEKLRNSESYWRQTEIEIENEKTKVESEINEMCQSVVPSSKTPTIENAQETVEELTESLREEKQLLKTLMQKTKDRECIKYEFKLQKKSLPVHFNESSTVDTVQGFMRRDDGEIESFSFDISKCDHVAIANSLWGLATNGVNEELLTKQN